MPEEVRKIAEDFREKYEKFSEAEAEKILQVCTRKMEICQIKDRNEYLPVLYKDEVKNYLMMLGINATSILRKMEVEKCAAIV